MGLLTGTSNRKKLYWRSLDLFSIFVFKALGLKNVLTKNIHGLNLPSWYCFSVCLFLVRVCWSHQWQNQLATDSLDFPIRLTVQYNWPSQALVHYHLMSDVYRVSHWASTVWSGQIHFAHTLSPWLDQPSPTPDRVTFESSQTRLSPHQMFAWWAWVLETENVKKTKMRKLSANPTRKSQYKDKNRDDKVNQVRSFGIDQNWRFLTYHLNCSTYIQHTSTKRSLLDSLR